MKAERKILTVIQIIQFQQVTLAVQLVGLVSQVTGNGLDFRQRVGGGIRRRGRLLGRRIYGRGRTATGRAIGPSDSQHGRGARGRG